MRCLSRTQRNSNKKNGDFHIHRLHEPKLFCPPGIRQHDPNASSILHWNCAPSKYTRYTLALPQNTTTSSGKNLFQTSLSLPMLQRIAPSGKLATYSIGQHCQLRLPPQANYLEVGTQPYLQLNNLKVVLQDGNAFLLVHGLVCPVNALHKFHCIAFHILSESIFVFAWKFFRNLKDFQQQRIHIPIYRQRIV